MEMLRSSVAVMMLSTRQQLLCSSHSWTNRTMKSNGQNEQCVNIIIWNVAMPRAHTQTLTHTHMRTHTHTVFVVFPNHIGPNGRLIFSHFIYLSTRRESGTSADEPFFLNTWVNDTAKSSADTVRKSWIKTTAEINDSCCRLKIVALPFGLSRVVCFSYIQLNGEVDSSQNQMTSWVESSFYRINWMG